ncbi:MAG: NAD(P)-dependent oxidoreductase [Acidimicrobiaceae bacterium]|nr:NAD(P)-dependent oxidoreductase [Acidimicrobiaceae bacterium]
MTLAENTRLPMIGFIGLGNMGRPMCRRLIAAGYHVTAFDINDSVLSEIVDEGAEAARSAAACAAQVDLLLTSLPHPSHVVAVMAGTDGALSVMQPGSIWVDLTTNRKDLIIELAGQAPPGVQVVDSPVTGAVDGARNGTLTLFVSGDSEPVAEATKVLQNLGLVIACGALGSGNVVKLVTNQLWFVSAAALGEAFAMGMANGVELATLWHAIKESVGDSFVVRHDAPSVFAGHYDPSFPLDLCIKDRGLLAELGENVKTDLPMTTAAHAVFEQAAARYGTDVGELHVVKRIEDDAGMSMRLDGDWVAPSEQ